MKLRLLFCTLVFAIAYLPQIALGKAWRNIVPLKSTRADVERRFGKPDKWGGYEFSGERVSFEYGDEPCKGLYLDLGEDNCKCLANDSAVMSIFVELTVKRKISTLKMDLKKFKKTQINPFPHTVEYENVIDGIVYTVDELEDEIKHITYYPSQLDCQEIIAKHNLRIRNSWRGLVPLRSTRRDLDSLLGTAKRAGVTLVTYETDHESIVATFADGKCDPSASDWNVPKDTLIEIVVNPNPSFLFKELHVDESRYSRREIFPYPEIDNPPKVWTYLDYFNGVTIRTQSTGGDEVVVSISYSPAKRDEKLRCK